MLKITANDGENNMENERTREHYETFCEPFITEEKAPSPMFKRLCKGLHKAIAAMNIGDSDADSNTVTPEKMAAFYRLVNEDFDGTFLHTPPDSLSYIYQMLGCYHSLQPGDSPYSAPTIPALLPAGFVQWQLIQILLCPEVHSECLQKALEKFNVIDPVTGFPFPKHLPSDLFPAEADPEMIEWYEGKCKLLEEEAMKRPYSASAHSTPETNDEIPHMGTESDLHDLHQQEKRRADRERSANASRRAGKDSRSSSNKSYVFVGPEGSDCENEDNEEGDFSDREQDYKDFERRRRQQEQRRRMEKEKAWRAYVASEPGHAYRHQAAYDSDESEDEDLPSQYMASPSAASGAWKRMRREDPMATPRGMYPRVWPGRMSQEAWRQQQLDRLGRAAPYSPYGAGVGLGEDGRAPYVPTFENPRLRRPVAANGDYYYQRPATPPRTAYASDMDLDDELGGDEYAYAREAKPTHKLRNRHRRRLYEPDDGDTPRARRQSRRRSRAGNPDIVSDGMRPQPQPTHANTAPLDEHGGAYMGGRSPTPMSATSSTDDERAQEYMRPDVGRHGRGHSRRHTGPPSAAGTPSTPFRPQVPLNMGQFATPVPSRGFKGPLFNQRFNVDKREQFGARGRRKGDDIGPLPAMPGYGVRRASDGSSGVGAGGHGTGGAGGGKSRGDWASRLKRHVMGQDK